MLEYALITLIVVIVAFMIFATLLIFHFMDIEHNINISVKQEFSESDRQLLEDIYNEKGDMKDKDNEVMEALDEVIKNINDVMLDKEDTDE